MKTLAYSLFYSLILISFAACTCEEHEEIITAIPDVFIVNDVQVDPFTVTIEFSKAIDGQSIQFGENFFLTSNGTNYDDDFVYGDNSISFSTCGFDCMDPETCTILIQLQPSDDHPILSIDGQILDGDRNGSDGGMYEVSHDTPSCLQQTFTVVPNSLGSLVSSGYYYDTSNVFIINFNRPANPETVVAGQTLRFYYFQSGELYEPFHLTTLSWTNNNTELRILTDAGNNILSNSESCDKTMIIELSDLVSDAEGNALDGDYDGMAGGNYQKDVQLLAVNHVVYVSPLNFNDFDHIYIDVDFRCHVDTTTTIAEKSVFLYCYQGGDDPNLTALNISLSFDEDFNYTRMAVRILDPLYSLCGTSGFLRLVLTDEVSGANGAGLDGDTDGLEGGDYMYEQFY